MKGNPLIRAYLDELAKELAKRSADCDRMLAEAEDHLLAVVERCRAEGVCESEAERTAVAEFGSPWEIAARWAMVRKGFSGRRHEWRWTAVPAAAVLLLMALLVLIIGDRGSEVNSAAEDPRHGAKAFTAVKYETFYDDSGGIQLVMTRTEAYRNDGARYGVSRSNDIWPVSWRPSLELVSIWDPVKRVSAMVLPEQGLVSSLPVKPIRNWSATAPRTCSYLMEALDMEPGSERAEMLGYEVRKHTFGPNGSSELWVAPKLDCYEMRSTTWRVDPASGQRNVARVTEVVFVREGEPPAEYFDLPKGFQECPPSRIFRAAQTAADNQSEVNSRRFHQVADERYRRIRGALE